MAKFNPSKTRLFKCDDVFPSYIYTTAAGAFPLSWRNMSLRKFAYDPAAHVCDDRTGDPLFTILYSDTMRVVPSITGHRTAPGYAVWFPVWECGDDSVGMPGAFVLDEDVESDVIAPSFAEAMIHIVEWMVRQDLTQALADAGEYHAHCSTEEL